MRSGLTAFEGCTTEESQGLEGIMATDALIETQLGGLESLLERQGDAALELSQLRQLRELCARLRNLLDGCEKMPAGLAAASR
jgi:hypothetical protein